MNRLVIAILRATSKALKTFRQLGRYMIGDFRPEIFHQPVVEMVEIRPNYFVKRGSQ